MGLNIPATGCFLVHAEGQGRPSCSGCVVQSGGGLKVFSVSFCAQVSCEHARLAFENSSDHSSVVTFAPEAAAPPAGSPRQALYQLRCN